MWPACPPIDDAGASLTTPASSRRGIRLDGRPQHRRGRSPRRHGTDPGDPRRRTTGPTRPPRAPPPTRPPRARHPTRPPDPAPPSPPPNPATPSAACVVGAVLSVPYLCRGFESGVCRGLLGGSGVVVGAVFYRSGLLGARLADLEIAQRRGAAVLGRLRRGLFFLDRGVSDRRGGLPVDVGRLGDGLAAELGQPRGHQG